MLEVTIYLGNVALVISLEEIVTNIFLRLTGPRHQLLNTCKVRGGGLDQRSVNTKMMFQ